MLLDRRRFPTEFADTREAEPWPELATLARPARAIWEIEADTLLVVLGALLEPGELRLLLRQELAEAADGQRDDVVLRRVTQSCSEPGPLARAVAARLDSEAADLGLGLGGCPLALLASHWQVVRDELAGRRLAALLWVLARDRRWELRGLEQRVSGDLLVRALRLLGTRAPGSA